MNCIRLSNKAYEELERLYSTYSKAGEISTNLDMFLVNLLSYGGNFRIYDRYSNKDDIILVGRECLMYMERSRRNHNCFYAKNAVFISSRECTERYEDSIVLPGRWHVCLPDEYDRETEYDPDEADLDKILSALKRSNKDFNEFADVWKTWDTYNAVMESAEERKEQLSVKNIQKVSLNNNRFTLQLSGINEQYKIDAAVGVLYPGSKRYEFLGKITEADQNSNKIEVECDDMRLIRAYTEGSKNAFEKCKIFDFGSRTRLRRQRDALYTLFQGDSANSNLKEILSGNYSSQEENKEPISFSDTIDLFGSNLNQKKAYIGALNADDLFMIQGPPGTGKTKIISELVRYIVRSGGKVLVSSETHIAVDNVLERIENSEGVIPVRLGNEERIGEGCRKFLPNRIASTMIETAKEKNQAIDRDGISPLILVKNCEEKWQRKIDDLQKSMDKYIAVLGDADKRKQTESLLEDFEKKASEIRSVHNEIEAERKEFKRLKDKCDGLNVQKVQIDERLKLLRQRAADPTLGTRETKNELIQLEGEQKNIDSQLEAGLQRLNKNRYTSLWGGYQRKLTRIERLKKEFTDRFGECPSITAKVREIREKFIELGELEKQRDAAVSMMKAEVEELKADFARKAALWQKSRNIRNEWMEVIDSHQVSEDIERLYIKQTNVILATCSGIASSDNGHFANMIYDYVIVDEAAKCNTLDLLIPLNMGKKIVLVGDHKQLYPVLDTEGIADEISEEQKTELKEHIIFKRLYEDYVGEECKIMLDQQYRMEKKISEFVSDNFYEGRLICEKDAEHDSLTWIDCEDSEEKRSGTSYYNEAEATYVIKLLKKLDRDYEKGTPVGVICTYKAQAQRLNGDIAGLRWDNIDIECSTVDAFQGKEKHTIIFNTVRSTGPGAFAKDENRVNVAVSRAREYLYVVGRSQLMKTRDSGILGKLYYYVQEHGNILSSRFMR